MKKTYQTQTGLTFETSRTITHVVTDGVVILGRHTSRELAENKRSQEIQNIRAKYPAATCSAIVVETVTLIDGKVEIAKPAKSKTPKAELSPAAKQAAARLQVRGRRPVYPANSSLAYLNRVLVEAGVATIEGGELVAK